MRPPWYAVYQKESMEVEIYVVLISKCPGWDVTLNLAQIHFLSKYSDYKKSWLKTKRCIKITSFATNECKSLACISWAVKALAGDGRGHSIVSYITRATFSFLNKFLWSRLFFLDRKYRSSCTNFSDVCIFFPTDRKEFQDRRLHSGLTRWKTRKF